MGTALQPAAGPPGVSREIGTAVWHTFVYSIGSLATKAIGFLLLPLYTYYLRPADYGALEVLDLTMSLVGMLLNLGVMASVLRFYAAAKSPLERRQVVGTAFLGMLAVGAVLSVFSYFLLLPVAPLLFGSAIPPVYIGLCFGSFLLNYIVTVPITYIRAKEASGTLVLLDIAATAITMALTVYCVAVLKWSLYGVLWSAFVVGCIRAPLLIWWMIRDIGISLDWGVLHKLVAFGAPLVFSNLAMFILNFSDRFFLQRLCSLDVVGVYAAGYKFGFLLNFVFIQSFNMMWQARMFIIGKQPDHEKTFAQILALYFSVLSFSALGLSLFGSEVVHLMVDWHYRGAEQIIPLVSLAYVCLAVGSYLQLGLFLSGKTVMIGKLCAVAAILSIGLNYLLIRAYGMLGAAWATVAGFALLAAGSYYCSQRAYHMDLKIGRILKGLLMGVALYLLSLGLRGFGFWPVLVGKFALLTSFPVALRIAGVLSADEMATLESLRMSAIGAIRGFTRPAGLKKSEV
jgi:O-antigen/teichoic acid export membrane protein